ncbi:MAG TPA: thiol:disulfide interchange protein DsbA/DsbL [Steroidobacteraceae bacterium]|nr:thiol:disulfide interchange protein DsbA/DsbL [Steroidobacteraceae bacterium]
MRTPSAIRGLLPLLPLLMLGACARQESAPTAAPAPPAAESTPPAQAAPAAPAASAQSEVEQAAASQESADGDGEHTAGDASLERMAGAPAGAQLPAGKWQPGVNYSVLLPSQPTNVSPGKVEVLEVFWLACPHCYQFEPLLRAWLKVKPAYVQFVRVPVIWQPIHRYHARLYYTLEALGRQDLIVKAFDTIAGQHTPLAGSDEAETLKLQQQFASANGVSADDFAKAYNSFSVATNMKRAEEITQAYRVEGVPFIAVNGKYTTDVAKAGGENQLIDLIGDLAAAEHGH